MKVRLIASCVLAVLALACGDDNPVEPTPTSPVRRYLVSGAITEPVGVAVEGSTVRFVDSERTQTWNNAGHEYRAVVREGAVTIEVTKEGYRTKSVSIEVPATLRQDLEIEPEVPPAVFKGPFWMSLSADPACGSGAGTLPPSLRARRYGVDVEQAGARLTVRFTDPRLTGQEAGGEIHGTVVSFSLWGPDWYYTHVPYTLEERLDDTKRLVYVGGVEASVAGVGAAGQLDGTWELQENGEAVATCERLHGVRFERR